ncbi:MAG: cysteine synthase family protein [Bacteroidia bacterium]|nr:cysteine synthase family protein [Bacteroidia bacterium]
MEKIFQKSGVKLMAKLEWQQMSGSVKARTAFQILKEAIYQGKLTRNHTVLEASSGNTGIALASICKYLGLELVLCLPEGISQTRQGILLKLGAKLEFSPREDGVDGAQVRAKYLYSMLPGRFFYCDQFNNPANWSAHLNGTGQEIWEQTAGEVTQFICALGTSGTFMGATRKLKALNPAIQAIALQPAAGNYGLEGWKNMQTSLVPGIYDKKIADSIVEVELEEAREVMQLAKDLEGLLLSPSSAAALAGALRVARQIPEGRVVTLLPDNLSKYPDLLQSLL